MRKTNTEPIALFLVGGNYPVIKDTKGRTVCEVPWQGDREATIALARKLCKEYAETGVMTLGPAPIKIRAEFAGFKLVDGLGDGQVIFEDKDGERSVWFRNMHHANPGLIYNNAHYEFARNL